MTTTSLCNIKVKSTMTALNPNYFQLPELSFHFLELAPTRMTEIMWNTIISYKKTLLQETPYKVFSETSWHHENRRLFWCSFLRLQLCEKWAFKKNVLHDRMLLTRGVFYVFCFKSSPTANCIGVLLQSRVQKLAVKKIRSGRVHWCCAINKMFCVLYCKCSIISLMKHFSKGQNKWAIYFLFFRNHFIWHSMDLTSTG